VATGRVPKFAVVDGIRVIVSGVCAPAVWNVPSTMSSEHNNVATNFVVVVVFIIFMVF
jgi:hypothetical protein